ncbi:MAG: cardiolipin synthase [Lachnospiraceae bacterium]|nr:cardiolipin synthase [Lachnospiraceae bacterium]
MESFISLLPQIGKFLWNNIIFLDTIFAIIIVFFQRKEPKSVWAWLLILYAIPILGFVLYLLLGLNFHKERMFRVKELEGQINEAIRQQEQSIEDRRPPVKTVKFSSYSDLIYYNLDSAGAVVTDDNGVEIFTDGNEKFNALIRDILNAKRFVFFQYYIIRDDELMERIADAMIKKAAEGVKIYILYDSMGCRNTSKRFWRKLGEYDNIEIAEFFPALLRKLHLRVNYRNHRKIAIIDNEIGYVGGYNVGREYIDKSRKFGHWRDTHFRITGTEVTALAIRFAMDYDYASRENLFSNADFFKPVEGDRESGVTMQIISSGPDSTLQNIRNNYLRLINKARKSIYIQTPYFIPDEAILTALLIAVHSGIEVNVMIPCKPDHPFVYWATYSYVGELVQAGANCYTYDNGFLHAKGMIVDEEIVCYGTANMDIRSFALNFEVNAIIYNARIAKEMTRIFRDDVVKSTRITKDTYNRRGLWLRFKEQFCRLLSPLL